MNAHTLTIKFKKETMLNNPVEEPRNPKHENH